MNSKSKKIVSQPTLLAQQKEFFGDIPASRSTLLRHRQDGLLQEGVHWFRRPPKGRVYYDVDKVAEVLRGHYLGLL